MTEPSIHQLRGQALRELGIPFLGVAQLPFTAYLPDARLIFGDESAND